MESLTATLRPHRDNIGQIASIVTICQFFAGTLICKDIYDKKSTRGIKSTPFVGGVAIGVLMLKLAYIMNDSAMFQVNAAAIVLNTLYVMFFYLYADDAVEDVIKPCSISAVLCAVFLGYANWENPANLEFRYGLLMTVLMLLLLAAPLADMNDIIRKKDASSIPFPVTFMGALVTFLWFVYGLAINNIFMIVQNLIGFAICAVQLFLIFRYPGSGQNKKNKKKQL